MKCRNFEVFFNFIAADESKCLHLNMGNQKIGPVAYGLNSARRTLVGRWSAGLFAVGLLLVGASQVQAAKEPTVSLQVQVSTLRNSTGVVQFSLYNKDGSIPDEKFKRYYRQLRSTIKGRSANVTFEGLPPGYYAVSIHHDENKNGKIDKGMLLPIEGVGFSNYKKIGLTNRPSFSGARFKLEKDGQKSVLAIYF